MNYVFNEKEMASARRKKRIILISYLIIFIVFLITVLCIVFVPSRNFSRHYHWVLVIINITLTTLFLCGSLFFYGLKFRLIRYYTRMFRDMDSGLKDEATGVFVEYDKTFTTKDGLTFYSLVLDAVPLRRDDISIRKVLIEHTRPEPDILAGERVRVVTHANILVAWERV